MTEIQKPETRAEGVTPSRAYVQHAQGLDSNPEQNTTQKMKNRKQTLETMTYQNKFCLTGEKILGESIIGNLKTLSN